jgi:hypothetical protein
MGASLVNIRHEQAKVSVAVGYGLVSADSVDMDLVVAKTEPAYVDLHRSGWPISMKGSRLGNILHAQDVGVEAHGPSMGFSAGRSWHAGVL